MLKSDYTKKSDARSSALAVLNRLDQSGNTLDRVLEEFADETMLQKDRSLMNAIVFGIQRQKYYIDHLIRQISHIPLERIEPVVMNILRIGLFQIHFLDKIPVSAAVNTAVELSKSAAGGRASSFVNALLRHAVRKKQSIPFPEINSTSIAEMAVRVSFPEWLLTRWISRFGLEETNHLCCVMNAIPPVTVRTNTLKINRLALSDALQRHGRKIQDTIFSPIGIVCSNLNGAVTDLPGFSDGWFQVQDESSQLAGYLLNPKPGESILDACAGLGGKTGHMVQLIQNLGSITAFDKDQNKLVKLQKEMHRLGASVVKTNAWDLYQPPAVNQPFDRILLDAPCSGLGVIRRNPDAKWRITASQLIGFQQRQVRFLTNLADLVKPSGILVYSVCSMEPEETEEVIQLFLARHPNYVIDSSPDDCPIFIRNLLSLSGYLQLFPHRHDTDGFFAARLKRLD